MFDHGLVVGEAPRQTHKGHYQNEKSAKAEEEPRVGFQILITPPSKGLNGCKELVINLMKHNAPCLRALMRIKNQ